MGARQQESGVDPVMVLGADACGVGAVMAGIALVEFVVFWWALLHFEVRLLAPGDVWHGIFALFGQALRSEPLDATAAL